MERDSAAVPTLNKFAPGKKGVLDVTELLVAHISSPASFLNAKIFNPTGLFDLLTKESFSPQDFLA